ncbi:MAG TPA: hypothetical protein VFG50_15235 [Rhodothermales bacterium]|nr:hypothetical protein [Rhodothermales bacterium]
MDIISSEDLREMAELRAAHCVSLYMPTYRFQSQLSQNPIRLKNLLRSARQQLDDAGVPQYDVETLLQPAVDLFGNDDFWLSMSDGLAAFLAPGFSRFLRLPVQFEELVVPNGRFHLTPLFPLVAADQKFYVLALSQKRVKLYQCTPYTVSEVHAPSMPESIQEALWADDHEAGRTQLHPGTSTSGASAQAAFHAHGYNEQDMIKRPHDDLFRFFQQVDYGLREALGEERAPLVLACVEYYVPIYHEANEYPGLITDRFVPGNFEYENTRTLHEQAWNAVRPIFLKKCEDAIARFNQLLNTDGDMASDDLKEIVPASVFSRVDTVFVPVTEHLWGQYDADQNTVEIHEERAAGDEDLLDLVAVHTYLNGGTVHAVEETTMPVKNAIAATFRYPAQNMTANQR